MGRLLARQRLVATIIAGAAAGCALQEPPSQADLRRDALPHTAVPAAWKAADAAAAAPLTDAWLASFDDAALTALVGEALAYNADLQVAAARVGQAQAMLQIASGSLLPAVGIPGTYSGKSGSGGGLNAATQFVLGTKREQVMLRARVILLAVIDQAAQQSSLPGQS